MRRSSVGALVVLAVCGWAAPAAAESAWSITVGGQAVLETGRLREVLEAEGGALLGVAVDLVALGPARLGLEAEGNVGRVSADLGTADDEPTVWRGRLGARATWHGSSGGRRVQPFIRGGGVYRADRGDLIEDYGIGWYVGAGLAVRLGVHWAVSPFVAYERAWLSVQTESWLLGLGLTFSP